MRKILIFVLIFCLFLTGCGKDTPDIDFETLLRQEAFPEGDPLSKELNAAVEITDLKVREGTITFTLRAPDISRELIAWYEAQEHFSGEALESRMRALLAGEKTEQEFTLTYTADESGTVILHYTEGYLSHMSCGIRAFYDYLYNQILGGAQG